MKFGVCADLAAGHALGRAGFDFIELNVQNHLKPLAPDSEFIPILKQIQACPIPCSAANCFVPGVLKITGPDVHLDKLAAYASVTFARAQQAGIQTIVFGSGGARQIPEGFDRNRAWSQLVEFGRRIGPLAHKRGVTVAVEPLNRKETNVLNSVAEGARYVREVNHPSVRLLADSFHWGMESESLEAIVAAGPLLRHVHVATFPPREPPGVGTCDLAPFFGALKKSGYDGAVSMECGWADLPAQAPQALATLKALTAGR
jgi:sugar phosphate isomerase/epimerase